MMTAKSMLDDAEDIGIAKGKAEVALNLLKMEMTIDVIANATGLTIQQVEELKN